MDEEPPIGMLTNQVYKGPASIPHANGDFFAAFFFAANVGYWEESRHDDSSHAWPPKPPHCSQTALVAHMFPGRVFGSELRQRKYE